MSYFNIRVYGVVINESQEILLSDERKAEVHFTKFTGGGLEIGEGLIDALKREFMEECNMEIEVLSHLYTTDFYEQSSFNDSQVISIYYLVKPLNTWQVIFKENQFDFDTGTEQAFRWKKLSEMKVDDLTFKTDKEALRQLQLVTG